MSFYNSSYDHQDKEMLILQILPAQKIFFFVDARTIALESQCYVNVKIPGEESFSGLLLFLTSARSDIGFGLGDHVTSDHRIFSRNN